MPIQDDENFPPLASLYGRIDDLKAQIDVYRPMEGDVLAEIRKYYRVGLTYSSSAIEGVSYTESETKVLLEDGLTVGGKPLRDALALIEHAKAYDHMFSLIRKKRLSVEDLTFMHSLFGGGLEQGTAGQYRRKRVFSTGAKVMPPAADLVPARMDSLQQWIDTERALVHPVEFAARLHLKFVAIHPFEDGNGRIARLAMNAVLLQEGYTLAVIPPILRVEYISCLQKSERGDDDDFIRFICRSEIETQKELLRLLRETDDHEDGGRRP